MKITEYTLLELEGVGKSYFVIQLSENMFYKTYEEDEIKVTDNIGFASRITNRKFAEENIDFLKKFYDEKGKRK